jgi:hypothetical protein
MSSPTITSQNTTTQSSASTNLMSADPALPTMPPGLEGALYGYQAKKGEFAGNPLFKLTYAKNKKADYGAGSTKSKYDIPDQVKFQEKSTLSSLVMDRLLKTEEEFKQEFAISTDVEGSGVAISVKAHFGLKNKQRLFSSNEYEYHLAYCVQTASEFWLNETPWSNEFRRSILAVQGLGTWKNSDFTELFNNFGTHFLKHGYLGGYMTMITDVAKSLVERSSSTEITASLRIGYEGVVRSGSVNVETAYNKSSFYSQNRSEMSVRAAFKGGLEKKELTDWYPTCFDSPEPLLLANAEQGVETTLLPITRLIQAGEFRDAMETALRAYIPEVDLIQPIFGKSQIWQADTVTRASSDGFLIGQVWASDPTSRGYISAKTESQLPVTVMRAASSVHFYNKSDRFGQISSFFMPVRKQDFVEGNDKDTYNHTGKNFRFIPFGLSSNKNYLGAWQKLDTNREFTAQTDGFVVCTIWADNASRGFAFLEDTTEAKKPLLAASSAHHNVSSDVWYQCQSFCAPVRQGRKVKPKALPTYGTIHVDAYWIPLEQARFGDPESRTANSRFTAETSGFLVGIVEAEEAGRGELKLRVGSPSNGSLGDEHNLGMASVHFYEGSDTWLKFNTTTVPVTKGSFYKADLNEAHGKVNCTLSWVPLIQI